MEKITPFAAAQKIAAEIQVHLDLGFVDQTSKENPFTIPTLDRLSISMSHIEQSFILGSTPKKSISIRRFLWGVITRRTLAQPKVPVVYLYGESKQDLTSKARVQAVLEATRVMKIAGLSVPSESREQKLFLPRFVSFSILPETNLLIDTPIMPKQIPRNEQLMIFPRARPVVCFSPELVKKCVNRKPTMYRNIVWHNGPKEILSRSQNLSTARSFQVNDLFASFIRDKLAFKTVSPPLIELPLSKFMPFTSTSHHHATSDSKIIQQRCKGPRRATMLFPEHKIPIERNSDIEDIVILSVEDEQITNQEVSELCPQMKNGQDNSTNDDIDVLADIREICEVLILPSEKD